MFALVALAACTYPEKELAGPFDCIGEPAPTTAEPIVMIRGVAVNPSDSMALSGIAVSLLASNLMIIDGPVTTGANGAFEFALNTNGSPVDRIYISGSGSGRVPTYHTNSRPITADYELPASDGLGVLSTMQRDTTASLALDRPFAAGTGAMLLEVNDCNNNPVANATLTSAPAGVIRYFTGVFPSMTATATDAGGVALVAELPPGMFTLTVRVGNVTYPARTYAVAADAFTQTILTP
jgi:hypothetical protein